MATKKEQNKVVDTSTTKAAVSKETKKKNGSNKKDSSKSNKKVKTFDRQMSPVEMVKFAFNIDSKTEEGKKNLAKMPFIKGVNDKGTNYNVEYLVDGLKKFFTEVDTTKANYEDANYADAALLAKAIVTCSPEYVYAMSIIVREMVKQTLAAVKAGLYHPLISINKVVKHSFDHVYIDRFISRASQILQSDEYTIIAKGPYFVFGWVDCQEG